MIRKKSCSPRLRRGEQDIEKSSAEKSGKELDIVLTRRGAAGEILL